MQVVGQRDVDRIDCGVGDHALVAGPPHGGCAWPRVCGPATADRGDGVTRLKDGGDDLGTGNFRIAQNAKTHASILC